MNLNTNTAHSIRKFVVINDSECIIIAQLQVYELSDLVYTVFHTNYSFDIRHILQPVRLVSDCYLLLLSITSYLTRETADTKYMCNEIHIPSLRSQIFVVLSSYHRINEHKILSSSLIYLFGQKGKRQKTRNRKQRAHC